MKFRKDKVEEGGWELPPPGVYECEVLNAEEYTSQTGNPTLKLRLELDSVENGNIFNEWISLQEKMMWRIEKMLNSMGIETDDDMDIDPISLVGRKCKVKVKHTTSGEYTNLKVESWLTTLADEKADKPKPKPKKKPINQDKGVNDPTDEDGDDVPF